ncbi:type III pantothenate kinase [Myxococcota bacterium]|nr:type III pantothenate kinase [Myxococcota bacterium]
MNSSVLTVNVGNTNVSVALCTATAAGVEVHRLAAWPTRDWLAREPGTRSGWLQVLRQGQATEVLVCCVVAAVEPVLAEWTSDAGVPCRFARHTDLRLRYAVPAPERVGMDRLINCSAAWRRFSRSCLVVDMGTAVTWDLVLATGDPDGTGEGVFAGGVIAPGLDTLAHALPSRTTLPFVEPIAVDTVVGRDTEACLRAGLWFGFLAQVDGIIARIEASLPEPPLTILTGGTAFLVAPHLATPHPVFPDLTHEGLAFLQK